MEKFCIGNSKKLLAAAIAAMMIFSLSAIPAAAATSYPAAINVPNGAATVDGVIEPGEWDEATPILMKLSDLMADQDAGIPGAGLVGGPRPETVSDDDMWVSLRMKVKDGFLYVLEERKDSTLQFAHDDPITSYASDGSIIFFWGPDGLKELSIIAETKSKTGPAFARNESEVISAEEAKATITANSVVLEAKFKLSDLEMTEESWKNGDYLVTYCAVNILEPNFSGSVGDLWGNNYQLQYKGVGPWEESVPLRVVAGADWPPPAASAEPEPEADAGAADDAAAPTDAPAEVPAPSAPKVGDGLAAALAFMVFAAGAFAATKRFAKSR